MVDDARAPSCAYYKMYDKNMREDFKSVNILGTWVHSPSIFHTSDPDEVPDDLEGMKTRGGSRIVNQLLELTGATPVGMPVPAITEWPVQKCDRPDNNPTGHHASARSAQTA